jgi:hypothetical protein
MPLVDVPIPHDDRPLPHRVQRFLKEADIRVNEALHESHAPAFVPSDYEGVFRSLRALVDGPLLRGNRFLEWGSGLGVATSLAAILEFEAHGIETDWTLVEGARELAEAFDLPVEFVHGSFVPEDGESKLLAAGDYTWLNTSADYAYDDIGLEPDDFDIVYAYPWPDEEQATAQLFHRYAGIGAVLLTYKGGDGFRLRRKVEGKKNRKK